MSSNLFPESGLGLVLSCKETVDFIKNINKHFPNCKISETTAGVWKLSDFITIENENTNEQLSIGGMIPLTDVHWYAFRSPVTNKPCNIVSNDIYGGCIIKTEKQPRVFDRSYKSTNEIVSELKTRIGKYLPEDFDYESHITLYELILE